MSDNYLLDGHTPVRCDDLMEWARKYETMDLRVAETYIGDDTDPMAVRVSTVFLSLDHSFGQGPPLLFETMVFGGTMDGRQVRYSTWDEAEAGHARIVDAARSAQEGEK